LLMFTLILHFLIFPLQILNLRILDLQFFESLVVLGVGVRSLNTIFLLLLLDLLEYS
jgi:hypothetical protein